MTKLAEPKKQPEHFWSRCNSNRTHGKFRIAWADDGPNPGHHAGPRDCREAHDPSHSTPAFRQGRRNCQSGAVSGLSLRGLRIGVLAGGGWRTAFEVAVAGVLVIDEILVLKKGAAEKSGQKHAQ